jgi:SAM-dependent methyltransferase
VKPWYEDDDFWAAAEAVLFPPDRLAAAKTETDGVLKLLSLKPGARILDLCCGPGRHAVEMARRGYKVTGADRNKAYLERARKSAKGLGLEIEFVEEDMRRFVSKDWKWMSPRWIIVKNGKRQELRWKIRLYSAAEFKTLLQGMGFQEVRVYGNLDGLPYGRSAKRLVAVAHKGRQHA